MINIVIFASGSGTNAQRIVEYFSHSKQISVRMIMTNNPEAYVLVRAEKLGIPSCSFSRNELSDKEKVLQSLYSLQTDYIVLAGFMWLMPAHIVEAFPQRILNIHPALLPAYGGKGMYGMNVHRAVIKAGEKRSGITIHLVDEMYDNGEALFQTDCAVMPNDSPENLAERIHQLEHEHFPRVIEEYCKEKK
jgi:phosphoribosylglycinamide formyltransferase 1